MRKRDSEREGGIVSEGEMSRSQEPLKPKWRTLTWLRGVIINGMGAVIVVVIINDVAGVNWTRHGWVV